MKQFFKDKAECEEFFGRMAKNNRQELTPEFIFEGGSNNEYKFIQELAGSFGYENIAVPEELFNDNEVAFCDEIFISLANAINIRKPPQKIWMSADKVFIDEDGDLRLWWD